MIAVDPEDWKQAAECLGVDPDLFFPDRGADTREIKAICAACPVRVECLQYAIDNGLWHGIWGGKSERQRRRLRVAQRKAESAGPSAFEARVLAELRRGPATTDQLARALGSSRSWAVKCVRELYDKRRVTRSGIRPYLYSLPEQP